MLGSLIPPDLLVPGGIVGTVVLLVLTGRFIPKSSADRERAALVAEIERIRRERDEWRGIALDLLEQNGQLLRPVRSIAEGVVASRQESGRPAP